MKGIAKKLHLKKLRFLSATKWFVTGVSSLSWHSAEVAATAAAPDNRFRRYPTDVTKIGCNSKVVSKSRELLYKWDQRKILKASRECCWKPSKQKKTRIYKKIENLIPYTTILHIFKLTSNIVIEWPTSKYLSNQ